MSQLHIKMYMICLLYTVKYTTMHSLQNTEEKTRYEVFRHGLFKPLTNPISCISHCYNNQGRVNRAQTEISKTYY